jgi:hypothetical protein
VGAYRLRLEVFFYYIRISGSRVKVLLSPFINIFLGYRLFRFDISNLPGFSEHSPVSLHPTYMLHPTSEIILRLTLQIHRREASGAASDRTICRVLRVPIS